MFQSWSLLKGKLKVVSVIPSTDKRLHLMLLMGCCHQRSLQYADNKVSFPLGYKELVIIMRLTILLLYHSVGVRPGRGRMHARQRKESSVAFDKFTKFLCFCESFCVGGHARC